MSGLCDSIASLSIKEVSFNYCVGDTQDFELVQNIKVLLKFFQIASPIEGLQLQ